MKKLAAILATTCILGAAQTAAAIEWKKGDISLTPQLGTSLVLSGVTDTKAAFVIGTDFDYHLTPNLAIGAMLNVGFGSDYLMFDVGPQAKWKFNMGAHSPYIRVALPLKIQRFSVGNFSSTDVGLGLVQFGGGYKYFFNDKMGVGLDVNFTPGVMLSKPDGADSLRFLMNIVAAFEIRFK